MHESEKDLTRTKEGMIRVDGRGQVLELLRYVDPAYRETLLRGIEKRDPQLARELRRELLRENN